LKRDIKDVFKYWMFKDHRQYGEFGLPLIEKETVIPKEIIPFNYASSTARKLKEDELKMKFIHFFIDDYQFERVWNNPKAYIELFKKYGGIIMPDYSVYRNFPKAVQVYNVFKSRTLSAYYQRHGIPVIPNITWSDEESLEWILDGLPKGSVIATSSNGVLNSLVVDDFVRLFNIVIDRLEPTTIMFVGKKPKNLTDKRIKEYDSHLQTMRRVI